MWIKASAPELMGKMQKIEKDAAISKSVLTSACTASAGAISDMLERGIQAGKIRGFKPHPEGFVGYLIAHESHHRGQIILTLKENRHLPDKKILFGIWEWGTR
jgi:uncharacterized damage-inducible protein DinB